MYELNVNQIPSFTPYGNFNGLLGCSSGGSRSHGIDLSPLPPVYRQQTGHYGEAAQYLLGSGSGCAPVPEASDFQGNEHLTMESTCMDKFEVSFQTDLLDANMLNDFHYQDLLSTSGLYCGQYKEAENEGQPNCSVKELEETSAFPSLANLLFVQNHSSRAERVDGNSSHVTESHLGPSKAASCCDPKVSKKRPREMARTLDCERRSRITKHIKDLEGLLPEPARGQVEVIAESIAYVKHLQHQLKELSQTRLRSETYTDPSIPIKESGLHLPQLFLKQPCEDVFGRLLQENPAAALELLESRGLMMVPAALADGLCQKE